MKIILLMLLVLIWMLSAILIRYKGEVVRLNVRNRKLEGENSALFYKYNHYKDRYLETERANWQLKSALEFYQRPDIKGGIEINEDVKQAIKFAMIKSHPDKGGKTEDFIKFRELYNKLKWR